MMWHFMDGCVIIQCTGRNLPRFLNLLRSNGILVEHGRGLPNGDMQISMRARDFRKIRPLVRQSGCRVHILERGGLPFLLWRIKRRPVLWIGMLLIFAGMLFASTRIIHIQVEGCQRIPESLILRALEDQGVVPFGPYPEQRLVDIAAMMRLYDERIAWVSLELEGSCLKVAVAEMETNLHTLDPSTPCDVVAVKDGVIHDIQVYEGHSPFAVGDSVNAGDVLIAGEYVPETKEEVDASMLVHARGDIVAEVYYFSEYAAEAEETALLDSGNCMPYREISLWGLTLSKTNVPYEHYEIRDVTSAPFGQSILPILVREGVCWEQTQQQRTRTRAEQTETALATAEQLAYLKIPKDAAIVDKLQRTTVEDGVVIGVVCIVTRETIGLEREIAQ